LRGYMDATDGKYTAVSVAFLKVRGIIRLCSAGGLSSLTMTVLKH
jgi:hypothetical protein